MIHQGCPRPRIYHGCLNSQPRSLRLYVLSLPLVSQFPLGPSLCHGFLIRPGGLLSRLLRTGGLRSRLCSTLGGSCLICSTLGGSCLVCSALGGSCLVCSALVGSGLVCPTWTWPSVSSPDSTALLDCSMCGASGSRSLGGGLCHESGS